MQGGKEYFHATRLNCDSGIDRVKVLKNWG